jgi:hypothetical protein
LPFHGRHSSSLPLFRVVSLEPPASVLLQPSLRQSRPSLYGTAFFAERERGDPFSEPPLHPPNWPIRHRECSAASSLKRKQLCTAPRSPRQLGKYPHLFRSLCSTMPVPPSAASATSIAALRKGQNVYARSEDAIALSPRLRTRKSSPNKSGELSSLSLVAFFPH